MTETPETLATEGGAAPPKPESYIASQATSALSMGIAAEGYLVKVYLAGPSGSGKTQAMVTIPGKKCLIDFDNRSETIAGTSDIEIIPCHEPDPRSPAAWTRAEAIRKQIVSEVGKGIFPYDGVIFDGLTQMGRISLNWALLLDPKRGLGGAPAQQHYLPQMDNLAKYVLSTLALPIHIGYTGHIELIDDKDTGQARFYPKITGKLRTELANWFNETYYCYRNFDAEKKKTRYYWQTAGSGKMEFFKSSLNSLGRYWVDPIEIDFNSGKPVGFEDLLARRFAAKSTDKTKGGEPINP